MSPTQAPHLVRALHAFDPQMRWRWARHGKHWVIELKMAERQPAWLLERPNPFGQTNRAKDTWEGYKDGYLFVTKMPHPVAYPWAFIAEHLRHLSLEAHQAKDRLIERLDAAEAEQEAQTKREWDVINEQGAKELYDRLQWDNKRMISTHVAGPNPLRVEHEGYVVYDRRHSSQWASQEQPSTSHSIHPCCSGSCSHVQGPGKVATYSQSPSSSMAAS